MVSNKTSHATKKVLVIGLDGASLSLIKKWVDENKLPFFKKIIGDGVVGDLRTVVPPATPPAWASFITGKNPGKHGILAFRGKKGSLFNASHINAETLWSILSRNGKRMIIVNVPMTYPVEKVNGLMVSGFLSPADRIYTYPQNLKEELLENVPDYRIYMKESDPSLENGSNADAWITDLYDITHKIAEAAQYFMKNYEWQFTMIVFSGTDWISHGFWRYLDSKCLGYNKEGAGKYGNAILMYYQEIDSILNNIAEQIDQNTTLMLMSDHGNGPIYDEFDIVGWLQKMNLMKLREGGDPRKLSFWFSKLGLSMEDLMDFVVRHATIQKLARLVWNIFHMEYSSEGDIEWPETRAYTSLQCGVGDYGISINMKGRETRGIVNPGKECEEIKDYIVKELSECHDPKTGNKIFEKVCKKEEIYSGPHLHEMPDLVYVTKSPYAISKGITIPRQILRSNINLLPHKQSSRHEMEGLLMLTGRNVKKGQTIFGANLVDLAPTILYLLDVPIPSDMDGHILEGALESGLQPSHEDVSDQQITTEKESHKLHTKEETELKKRLRELGYFT